MALGLLRAQEAIFQHVLGAAPEAVEAAVLDRRLTGEPDITKVVSRLAELFATTKADVYVVLGVTSSKVSRKATMNVDILDRAGAALKLFARVAAMLGEEDAAAWFKAPNAHLNGKRPVELLASGLGRQRLSGMVAALEDGAFL